MGTRIWQETATSVIGATCATPVNVLTGDVLFAAAVSISSGAPIAAPSGWITLAQPSQGTHRLGCFYRIVPDTAAEPATHTFTGWAAVEIVRISGVDRTAPLRFVTTEASGSALSLAMDQFVTDQIGSAVLLAGYSGGQAIVLTGVPEIISESSLFALGAMSKTIPGLVSGVSVDTDLFAVVDPPDPAIDGTDLTMLGVLIGLNPKRSPSRIGRNPLNRFTVWKRGWTQPKIIEGSGIICTRAINSPGTFGAIVPADQELTGDEWLGRWITWEHPTGGLWAGYIEDAPSDAGQSTIEIVAVGHANILKHRRTIRRMRPASGPPGAILTTAMAKVQLDAGMAFNLSVSERGPQLSYEFRAESVDDLMSNLISASGQEWTSYLDQNHALQLIWRARVGRDETSRIVFTDGINIAGLRNAKTINGMVNDLLGIADDEQYERAAGARIQSRGSIGQYGNFQATKHYVGMVSKSTLGKAARHDLASTSLPVMTPEFQVPHLDWRLASIREGTQFRLVSAIDNAVYRARVLAYSINVDAGVTTLTCDAVQDITRAAQQAQAGYGGIVTVAGA